MESLGGPWLPRSKTDKKLVDPRYLYSYFALYGDPLLEPEIDPFPDGLSREARTERAQWCLDAVCVEQYGAVEDFPRVWRDRTNAFAT